MSHFESSVGERTLEMVDLGICCFLFRKGRPLEIRLCYKTFGKDSPFKVDSNHINCSMICTNIVYNIPREREVFGWYLLAQ